MTFKQEEAGQMGGESFIQIHIPDRHRLSRTDILINPNFIEVKPEVQNGQVIHSSAYLHSRTQIFNPFLFDSKSNAFFFPTYCVSSILSKENTAKYMKKIICVSCDKESPNTAILGWPWSENTEL